MWKMQRRFPEFVRKNLIILAEISIIDVLQGSKYGREIFHILLFYCSYYTADRFTGLMWDFFLNKIILMATFTA